MNGTIYLQYIITLLMLVPTLLYAVMPLKDSRRFDTRKSILLFSAGLAAIILLLGLLGAGTGISGKWVFAIGLVPVFLMYHFMTRISFEKKLFCFFNSTMITTNAILYGTLISAPFELENSGAVLLAVSGAICLATSAVFGIIYFKTLTVKIPFLLNSDVLDLNWQYTVLIPAAISVLFFWVTPRSAAVVMTGRVRITTLAFLLLAPIVFLLVYQALWRIAVNLTDTARLKEEKELLEMERKRYEELRSYMNETRAMRHDFRQHLLVIEEYAKNGENEKLTAYIGRYTKALADHKGSFAANAAVDAVASHYDAIAEEQNTRIKWLLELPEDLPLPESDFITIFGNLVENALLAVSNLEEGKRIIHITARMLSESMLGLTVKNPYAGIIKFGKNGLPLSERPDHGVGLSSVAAAVHRYNGALEIDTRDGIFTAGVLLYL